MGRWWALGAALCLVVGGLIACGGAAPTATAPYVGARLHGYPVPGEYRVISDDGNGLYVVVPGEVRATVDTYVAAWRADGWGIGDRTTSGTTDFVSVSRGDKALTLLFHPYTTGDVEVFIPMR